MMLPQFKDYDGKCRLNGPLCKACRSPYKADWREAQTGMREFPCPFDAEKQPLEEAPAPIVDVKPAKITPSNVADFVKTVLTSPKVSEQVREERLQTCKECKYYKEKAGNAYCGVPGKCNCSIGGRKINAILTIKAVDLTLYEQSADKKLCNHPKRGEIKDGKIQGWRR